jgi:hypothetical protein
MHNHFDCCREFAKQYSPKGVGEVLLIEMSAIKIVMLIIVLGGPSVSAGFSLGTNNNVCQHCSRENRVFANIPSGERVYFCIT